jgi:hypothetical protein
MTNVATSVEDAEQVGCAHYWIARLSTCTHRWTRELSRYGTTDDLDIGPGMAIDIRHMVATRSALLGWARRTHLSVGTSMKPPAGRRRFRE